MVLQIKRNVLAVMFIALSYNSAFAEEKAKSTSGQVEQYVIDPDHTKVGFEVSHLVIATVDGRFRKFEGEFSFTHDSLTQASTEAFKLDVKIDVASIDTDVEKRDNHLRSPDFFDVKKFPTMTFEGKSAKVTGEKTFDLTGLLTIKGNTKPVTLNVVYLGRVIAYDRQKVAFKAKGSVNRKDFGLTWNDFVELGPVVGDTVGIILNVEGTRKKDL